MRSVRAVSPVWPSPPAQANRPAATLHRRQTANRAQKWVLVASAFVLGLALGAAGFVGVWRTTATRGDRADAARVLADRQLRTARARSAVLSTRLHQVKGELASTVRERKQLKVELRNAARQAAVATQQAASDRATVLTVRHRASTVVSYVASLEAYVKATPSQSLDSGFLQSQLTYLSDASQRLQAP
jgi:hypothetical protein